MGICNALPSPAQPACWLIGSSNHDVSFRSRACRRVPSAAQRVLSQGSRAESRAWPLSWRARFSSLQRRARSASLKMASTRQVVGSSDGNASDGELRIEIESKQAWDDIKLSTIVVKRAKFIVVDSVVPGSVAMELGVKVGSKLKALSDPVRPNEMWELNEKASLRFVRDAIRMRISPTITLVFSEEAPTAPAPITAPSAVAAPSSSISEALPGDARSDGETSNTLPEASKTMGSIDLFTSRDDGEEAMEVAENASEQTAAAEQQRQLSAADARMKARKAYLEEVGERNDSKFFSLLALAFLAPAAIILFAAFASGYLDDLQMSTLSR